MVIPQISCSYDERYKVLIASPLREIMLRDIAVRIFLQLRGTFLPLKFSRRRLQSIGDAKFDTPLWNNFVEKERRKSSQALHSRYSN